MADFRAAFAPLGPWMRMLLALVLVEVALLLAELLATHAIGQRSIAAAMITPPRSAEAVLGAVAVVLRIAARAIFPASSVFFLARSAAARLLS